jgi:hypothetical protein
MIRAEPEKEALMQRAEGRSRAFQDISSCQSFRFRLLSGRHLSASFQRIRCTFALVSANLQCPSNARSNVIREFWVHNVRLVQSRFRKGTGQRTVPPPPTSRWFKSCSEGADVRVPMSHLSASGLAPRDLLRRVDRVRTLARSGPRGPERAPPHRAPLRPGRR